MNPHIVFFIGLVSVSASFCLIAIARYFTLKNPNQNPVTVTVVAKGAESNDDGDNWKKG